MPTRIAIIDEARVTIGAQALMSEDAKGADSCINQYETHVGALVSNYPWSFQTRLRQLGQLTTPPPALWTYGYQLPSDMTGAPNAVYDSPILRQPLTDWERLEDKIYTNATTLWLRYTFILTPNLWPPYFKQLAVMTLAAEFALTIREEPALRGLLRRDVFGPPEQNGEGGMLASARARDARGQPSRSLPVGSNPLVAVRFT